MLVLRVIILFLMCSNITGQSYQNLARLKQDLLQNYTKSIRPLRYQNETLRVYIDVHLDMVEEFNIMEGVLGTHLTFTLRWVDELIRWDSEEYDNITVIHLPHLDVWVPQIALLNPADNFGYLIGEKDMLLLVQYTSEGSASLVIATYLESTCDPYIKYFPLDSHTCHLMISHIGYSIGEVISVPSVYYSWREEDSGQWRFSQVHLTNEFLIPGVHGSQYADISIKLSRRSQLLLFNLFLPIIFLMVMNVLVFFVPAECGERASYSITLFLAVVVFIIHVMEHVPVSAEFPYICIILFIHLMNNAIICWWSATSLFFHHGTRVTDCFFIKLVRFIRWVIMSCRTEDDTGQSSENMFQRAETENRDITHPAVVSVVIGTLNDLCFEVISMLLNLSELFIFSNNFVYGEVGLLRDHPILDPKIRF